MKAAIDSLKTQSSLGGDTWEAVRGLLWSWVLANGDHEVSIKVWFFNRKVKLRDLHFIFELLLGKQSPNLV